MAQPAPDSGPSPSLAAQDDSAAEAAAPGSETAREALAGVDSDTGLWIVQLDGPSAAAYGAENSLDTAGTAEYAEQLAAEHDDLSDSISSTLGRDVQVHYSYVNALNGIAIEADADEAAQLWDLPGVEAVFPDIEHEMETDVSHDVIKSAAIWDGETGPGIDSRGEGVIVAMIDSGVNPEHPAFAAEDGFGYVHENPLGAGNYLGACETEAGVECNDKLIGAYTFNGPTAIDTDDHGSHVGSTIAGNHHMAEFEMGTSTFEREVQGVAPRANVISYKVCNPGCPSTASVAAVDQAIADGVDVLNYSISGADNPWNDSVDLAFLDAHDAGITVAASAGNSGPGASTVAKTGPWNMSVAATTHNRVFGNEVSITAADAPEEVTGLPGFPGDGPAITEDYTGNLVDAATVGNVEGCTAFDDGVFEDSIALIQRGNCEFSVKVNNAEAAGANAVVMFNNVGGPPTAPGGLAGTTIPAVMLTLADGEALQDYLADGGDPEVVLGSDVVLVEDDNWTDLVAGFSSRGPSQFDMLAPTLAAPGVNILAAFAEADGDTARYGAISGTSMASPHAAGSAALLTEVYPDLTPTQLRSVLASTADYETMLKEDGLTEADHFDIGSGRINLDQASRAGLALDETGENFAAANPALGGEPSELNLPAFAEWDCEGVCEWTRTVSSISDASASYTAVVDAPEGVDITVTPSEFTLEPGAEQELTVSVNVSGGTVGEWAQGRVTLETTDAHTGGADIADAQFPVAVMVTDTAPPEDTPVIEVDPAELASTQAPDAVGTEVLTIGNVGTADLEWEFVDELAVSGTLHEQEVNGTSGIVSDLFPNNGGGVYTADDFTFDSDAQISSIYTPGFWVGDDVTTRSPAVDWEIYDDNDGEPGDVVWSHHSDIDGPGLSIVDNEITLDVVAASDGTIDLEAGTYWLSVWPTVTDPFPDLNDRWNWYQGTPTDGPAMINDPQGLFGAPPGWNTFASLGVTDFTDVAFTLEGTAEPVSCGADWLSVDPASGTTAPDGTTEVTAEFDATGLEEGDYTTQLCIESNDPAEPGTTVPVTLTVEAPEAAPSITIDPESIEGSQAPDEQTEHTLTVGNVGDADLEFAIEETEAGSAGAVDSDYEAVELPVGSDRATDATVEGSAPAVVEGASVPLVSSLEEGFEDVEALPGEGWSIINTSEPVGEVSWFQGNTDVFQAHEGPEDSYAGANFNGTGLNGDISTWLVTPEVDLADGSELTFWTRSTEGDWADRMEVRLSTAGDSDDVGTGFDDAGDFETVLLTINEDLEGTGYPQEWTEFTVTVEGVEAGDTGRFAFRHHVPDGGAFGTHSDFIGVDTVSYETAAPACEVTDIPWLTVDPTEGTVAPDGSQEVTVGLDSSGLELGDHTAELCVTSNDPANPVINVPVTLTVTDEEDDPAEVQRVFGDDRWATAAEIAAEFPDGVDTVYIANGTEVADGADALASGAAAARGALEFLPNATPDGEAAPILLVKNEAVPQATRDALASLEPSNVVIVGGPTSVGDGVEDEISDITGADMKRIYGEDRYETAALIAAEYGEGLDTVYVATGVGDMDTGLALADALTAASLAGSEGSPVVLAQPGNLPDATADVLTELAPANIVVVGGEEAVGASVEAELAEIAPTTRLSGDDRYGTAVALTQEYAQDGDMLYVASGTSFPDALTGSSLTGSEQAPLLVTRGDHLPEAVSAEILRLSPQGITIFGGTSAVDADVEAALQELLDQTSTD